MGKLTRRPVAEPTVSVDVASKLKPLKNESIYSFWCRYALANSLNRSDVTGISDRLITRPIFVELLRPVEDVQAISSTLGISAQKVEFLRGNDLDTKFTQFLLTKKFLRYCRKCIKNFYHSVLYQHLALGKCPLHDIAFEMTCRVCNRWIEPSLKSSLESPFECPECNSPIGGAARVSVDSSESSIADQMVGSRRKMLTLVKYVWHSSFASESIQKIYRQPSAVVSRTIQRIHIWSHLGDSQWQRFSSQTLIFRPEHTRGEVNDKNSVDVGLAAERVMIWLRGVLGWHERGAIRLANRLHRHPGGLRINSHESIVAAAYYKLAVAYDLVQEISILHDVNACDLAAKSIACYGRSIPRYGLSAPAFPELDYHLIRFEMLGMFAKFLIEFPDNFPMMDVNWTRGPSPLEITPSWTLENLGPEIRVQIRSRASESLIEKIVKRRMNHFLRYVADDPEGPNGLWGNNRIDAIWHSGTLQVQPTPTSQEFEKFINPESDEYLGRQWPGESGGS